MSISDNVLYLCQVFPKYLKRIQSYRPDSRVDTRVVANVDGQMYKRTETTGGRHDKNDPQYPLVSGALRIIMILISVNISRNIP